MTYSPFAAQGRQLFRAIFAGVALFCAWTAAEARASCGEYVVIGGRAAHGQMHHAPAHHSDAPATPCHGPGCSQRQQHDSGLPIPQVTVAAEHWAVLEAIEGISPVRVDRRLAEDSRLAASPSPLDVYRPPR